VEKLGRSHQILFETGLKQTKQQQQTMLKTNKTTTTTTQSFAPEEGKHGRYRSGHDETRHNQLGIQGGDVCESSHNDE
jgi:hypothetical protein